MNFERITELAQQTPIDTLCVAWNGRLGMVRSRLNGERPLTLRELGALAEVHEMTLLDILAL